MGFLQKSSVTITFKPWLEHNVSFFQGLEAILGTEVNHIIHEGFKLSMFANHVFLEMLHRHNQCVIHSDTVYRISQ